MENIIIYDLNTNEEIVMPRTRDIIITALPIFTEITMASGKNVRDIQGSRVKISAEYDYLPHDIMIDLHKITRTCRYVRAKYPDIDTEKEMICSINIPESGVYTFENDKPCWHKARLELIDQEVK